MAITLRSTTKMSMLNGCIMMQILLLYSCLSIILIAPYATACSSRAIQKPRATTTSSSSSSIGTDAITTTMPSITNNRPNISFPILNCPATYDAWYCLNDATCFAVEIHNEIIYFCECANGFVGQRCEYKEIDGSYFPARRSAMLRTASIASGVVLAVFMAVLLFWFLYVRYGRKNDKESTTTTLRGSDRSFNGHENPGVDEVDSMTRSMHATTMATTTKLRPFGPHHFPIKSMAEVLLKR